MTLLRRGSEVRVRACRFGVLFLTAVPFNVDQQLASNIEGRFVAEIFCNQKQREINAGSGPRGAVKFPIFHYECALLHLNLWKPHRDIDGIPPMRSDAATFEQPCGSKTIHAGAN